MTCGQNHIWKKSHRQAMTLCASICSFIALLLTGCTDDWKIPNDYSEDFTGVTLLLPDLKSAAEFGLTRADEGTVEPRESEQLLKEADFTDLYLLVINKTDNSLTTYNLMEQSPSQSSTPGYTQYKINLEKASTYKFYLLGNLDSYLDGKVAGLKTESEILDAILYFNDIASGKILVSGNLPMACLANRIGVNSPNAYKDSGEVTIENNKATALYADLSFLCSKVRYTVLFDKEEDEDNTFNSADVDFTDVTAGNVRKSTAVAPDFILEAEWFDGSVSLPLSKVEYPKETGTEGNTYFNPARTEAPDNLTPKEPDFNWTRETQRAWQGTAYIPENILTDGSKVTTLNFLGVGDELKDSYPLPLDFDNPKKAGEDVARKGLVRSSFYDVVIRLQNPESIDRQEAVSVTVEDWDPKTIEYKLHGDYWLEVEDYLVEKVISGVWSQPFGFDCNDEVSNERTFEVPKINYGGEDYEFFEIQLVTSTTKDDQGNFYELDPKWKYYLRLRVNPDLPYKDVLKALKNGTYDGLTLGDLQYFHIISGNIHKRIEIGELDLNPYLIVEPLNYVIDVREKYYNGADTFNDVFKFHANFDDTEQGVSFTLNDHDGLLALGETGKGDGALVLSVNEGVLKRIGESNIYNVLKPQEVLHLVLDKLISGNPYWTRAHEYRLTFTLTEPEEGITETRTINIIVKPFSTTYTIHFRDNTKTWEQPHIYVYQLLTLPTDLTEYPEEHQKYDPTVRHQYAGKLIGYVEDNSTSRMQWNGAVKYVFTNNLAFKGWKGYGGPAINDPYITWEETGTYEPYDNYHYGPETKGFLMFGEHTECPYKNAIDGYKHEDWVEHYQWNFDYSYTYAKGVENNKKFDRYYFDINLNADHEEGVRAWSCEYCKQLYYTYKSDYNYESDRANNSEGIKHTRFYPGIAMEKDEGELGEQGWWKYTLSGVAEPGRTVMFFTNLHLPWEAEGKNYGTEDNRYPADYEAGIPLFDFADNEGWFQFNGNSTDRDQHFTDEMPAVILNKFDADMASRLRLEILKSDDPNDEIEKITVGYREKYRKTDDKHKYEWGYNDKEDIETYLAQAVRNEDKKYNLDMKNFPALVGSEYLIVKIFRKNKEYKKYYVPTKFFRLNGGKYVTRQPLLLEFNTEVKLFVKWNDHITISSGWVDNNPKWTYYNEVVENKYESNQLDVYEGKDNRLVKSYEWKSSEQEIGNYKYKDEVIIPAFTGSQNRDFVTLDLNYGSGSKPKYLRVEDLPQYYIPGGRKYNYLINWHMLDLID